MRAITVKIQREEVERPLTIIVGLNVSKKAVERNKIRRRVRAVMREKLKNGKKYVVIVHPEAKNISFQELQKEIEKQSLILNP